MASTSQNEYASQQTPPDATDPSQSSQQVGEIDESQFTTAPICLVLTEDVHKIFEKGDPLIVGTSMQDIQIFFQKVIAEAQVGLEGAVSTARLQNATPPIATLKATLASTNESPKRERYPVPRGFIKRGQKPTKAKRPRVVEEVIGSSDAIPEHEEDEDERNEIPVEAIRYYLAEKKYYPGWTANAKRNLRKRCDDFELDAGILYYKTKKGGRALCIEDPAERMRLLWQSHSIDHRRRDRLFRSLRDEYYWKGMLNDVNKVLDTCEHCSLHRDSRTAVFVAGMKRAALARRVHFKKSAVEVSQQPAAEDVVANEEVDTMNSAAEEDVDLVESGQLRHENGTGLP